MLRAALNVRDSLIREYKKTNVKLPKLLSNVTLTEASQISKEVLESGDILASCNQPVKALPPFVQEIFQIYSKARPVPAKSESKSENIVVNTLSPVKIESREGRVKREETKERGKEGVKGGVEIKQESPKEKKRTGQETKEGRRKEDEKRERIESREVEERKNREGGALVRKEKERQKAPKILRVEDPDVSETPEPVDDVDSESTESSLSFLPGLRKTGSGFRLELNLDQTPKKKPRATGDKQSQQQLATQKKTARGDNVAKKKSEQHSYAARKKMSGSDDSESESESDSYLKEKTQKGLRVSEANGKHVQAKGKVEEKQAGMRKDKGEKEERTKRSLREERREGHENGTKRTVDKQIDERERRNDPVEGVPYWSIIAKVESESSEESEERSEESDIEERAYKRKKQETKEKPKKFQKSEENLSPVKRPLTQVKRSQNDLPSSPKKIFVKESKEELEKRKEIKRKLQHELSKKEQKKAKKQKIGFV
eukprot:TRINITY_DN4648_c0_g1_i1.p1 TRINITY_DN4648_c0_g1~~TRINITY_DN4648_c0_g1_i1.p1  ORF type:complete len:486 (+),score=166.59 TRINITY_DN4648_c0_g1_i1:1564-3021(+)